jgi:hypothetical protein
MQGTITITPKSYWFFGGGYQISQTVQFLKNTEGLYTIDDATTNSYITGETTITYEYPDNNADAALTALQNALAASSDYVTFTGNLAQSVKEAGSDVVTGVATAADTLAAPLAKLSMPLILLALALAVAFYYFSVAKRA